MPKFDEVKPQIEQYVTRKAQAELVTTLRASAKIEKMDKTEPPAAPDAAGAGQEVEPIVLHQMNASWPALCRALSSCMTRCVMSHATVSPLAPHQVPDMPAIAGVRLATAEAGIRYAGRTDVLLALFDAGTTAAGVFTRSKCPSAPVEWCRGKLKAGKARARWWSIPATPMPSPARAAAAQPSSPPRSPPRPPAASRRRFSSPRPA